MWISLTRLSRSLACFSKQLNYRLRQSCSGPTTPEEYFRFGLYRFRSPLLTVSISLSFPPLTEMFHFSGCRVHKPMYSAYDDGGLAPSGYPIRIPPGLSSLAALRGFSQLVASFFACQHQGIHHKPLGSLFTCCFLRNSPVIHVLKSFPNANPLCMLDSCLYIVLYNWKLCFPQNCWSSSLGYFFFCCYL